MFTVKYCSLLVFLVVYCLVIIYGYKIDGRKIVVDENNAAVVRFMHEQYANGVFVKDIIKTLTEKNIFYKRKTFR